MLGTGVRLNSSCAATQHYLPPLIQSLIVSLVTCTKGRRRGGGGRGKWKRKRKMRKKEGRKEERKKYFPVGCHQFLFSFLFYSIIFTNVLLKR